MRTPLPASARTPEVERLAALRSSGSIPRAGRFGLREERATREVERLVAMRLREEVPDVGKFGARTKKDEVPAPGMVPSPMHHLWEI